MIRPEREWYYRFALMLTAITLGSLLWFQSKRIDSLESLNKKLIESYREVVKEQIDIRKQVSELRQSITAVRGARDETRTSKTGN